MMKFTEAETLAKTCIDVTCSGKALLLKDETISKSYGWVFFYQSKEYLETKNFSDMLLGNAPILIDRFSHDLKVFGTAYEVEHYLKEYEATIPKARMEAKPELPPTN